MTDLVGVVLAAGAGTRLRPLTDVRPKPLCTVGGRTLLDLALERLAPHVRRTAVNAHHLADQVRAAVADRDLHLSVEQPRRARYGGSARPAARVDRRRPVLVTNADAFFPHGDPVGELLAGWDGERPRLLCVRDGDRGDFGDLRYVGTRAAAVVVGARPRAASRPVSTRSRGGELHADGSLDLAVTDLPTVDCGTPADYLRANMAASGGAPVVGAGSGGPGRAGPVGGLVRRAGGSGRAAGRRDPRGRGHPEPAGRRHAQVNDSGVIRPYDGPDERDDACEPRSAMDAANAFRPNEAGAGALLSERDQEILAFERQWWKYAGAKEQAIRELFDMSATRYYQVLNALIDRPEALASDPMLVKRLRRLRSARQRARSARRLGIEV